MKNKKKLGLTLATLGLLLPGLASCGGSGDPAPTPAWDGIYFRYEDPSFVDKIGSKTNEEVYNYQDFRVNKVEGSLRSDFAYGVDASMVRSVEKNGGVYYNQDGKEQDIFQILRRNGVNFVRFRLWNKPYGQLKNRKYGGGDNDYTVDLEMARRAKAANLNVMIDFHYSDFWADPDHQQLPSEWGSHRDDFDAISNDVSAFTSQVLGVFRSAGVTVDAVQIGNEINNGMCGLKIDWSSPATSFDNMSKMLKAGIAASKSVFPNVRTIVHLANGGNTQEFETFFTEIGNRGVNYDIIGASYYPHLSGSLNELQENLNNVTSKTGKPVMVVETSWGFTDEYNEYCNNTYSSADEDVGGYLTSYQAQITCVRDICNVLSKVQDNNGLGIFYWEPAWLPVEGAGWATNYGQSYQETGTDENASQYTNGLATWSNQGWFSYTGKMLPSAKVYQYVKEGFIQTEEVSTKVRKDSISVTLNLAEQETLPATGKVETNLDAIRERECVWDNASVELVKTKGTHTNLSGMVEGKYSITATAKCIQNFIRDPGFENQGTTDAVKDPWHIDYSTPAGLKVIKLDRKKDTRSGKTDLNWYCGSGEFTFKVSQTITINETGEYTLRTYIMCAALTDKEHTTLKLFIQVGNEAAVELDLCTSDYIKGWSEGYQECVISGVNIEAGQNVTIGLYGAAANQAWGHNDDWELVNNN